LLLRHELQLGLGPRSSGPRFEVWFENVSKLGTKGIKRNLGRLIRMGCQWTRSPRHFLAVLACFEEALRHSKLGAVVAEVSRLSMTASRRLQLAAEGSEIRKMGLLRQASQWHRSQRTSI
jgi:hypothetical protein